ncbi:MULTISPECIES: hypothetical protein [unclassified Parafrankia]|uniref:hypothetical protein n=1 Tax=unclassified Parafrankia TaxID=2994368 RepID=UPI000DA48C1A|nr:MULTISPECIES: hypothetical protein [unclassified Parafrankia]TCJ40544.1 hypothetical protein E0504_04275 [Parafrankia sp. BMG5.11]CAI7974767.1 conserved membrane hypothetical protein [Frankia sp. Hr75.2]SQD95204.1 conserved membrane hypothetical protein [Parafrankia sp. Ea1.12]
MPDSSAFDVLIGLALLFAVFSLAVSRINEAVLALFRYRGRQLEAELRRLLGARPAGAPDGDPEDGPDGGNPPDVAAELLDGPLRTTRATGRNATPPAMADHPPVSGALAAVRRARSLRLPSYVPSTAFAQALLDRVDPPARAMLSQLRPETLPDHVTDEARAAYRRAYDEARHALDERTAQALYAAMPADHPAGRVMAAALVAATGSGAVGTIEDGLASLPPSPAKDALIAATVQAAGDREKIVTELARWYDDAMDRLSGWYRRRIAIFLLCYAILLAVPFNLDAIGLARAFWQDGTVRQAAVAAAQVEVTSGGAAAPDQPEPDQPTAGEAAEQAVQAVRDASGLAVPIGWVHNSEERDDPREVPDSVGGWLLKIAGLAIGCFALTAGAPFWFDLLGRLVNMRATGPKPRATNG